MIIVRLKGGLGNQMFQYAFGRALSIASGQALKLDIEGYKRPAGADTPRRFALDAFDIKAVPANAEEVKKVKYPFGFASRLWRAFSLKILQRHFIPFQKAGYDALVAKAKSGKDVYVDGFFQSEKYFTGIEADLHTDFTLRKPMSPAGQNAALLIARDSFAVSLHIRRGDYVTSAKTQAHHGSCDIAYYEKAVAQMPAGSTFYVFSDDIAWAEKNLKLGRPTIFVSKPDIKDVEEMVLMSACRHNIIANSSFSWWAAWLNAHPGKIVIAPKTWARKNDQTWYKDIVPSSWTRI
jgi:hypothetical protein